MNNEMQTTRRLPAEWEPQDAVLLAWPHGQTDWSAYLDEVQAVYRALIKAIVPFERVILVTPEPDLVKGDWPPDRVQILGVPTNDTWIRDFGPITVCQGTDRLWLDFCFSGWGHKFEADLDNQVTRSIHTQGVFGATGLMSIEMVLEGGSIESDGAGTLMTTTQCLLNPNRNAHLNRTDIEARLMCELGVDRFLWLERGYLAGDDTDAHIDTLARFAPHETIVHVTCPDSGDSHYEELQAMEAQLKTWRSRTGQPYRLLALPWPAARFDGDGCRLPATYANFLVINGAVLVPVYGDPRDTEALQVIEQAFPGRRIIGIDCSVLIRQHGSLHCATMQLPQGVCL